MLRVHASIGLMLVMSLAVLAQGPAPTYRLDLTSPDTVRSLPRPFNSSLEASGSGQKRVPLPLRLELVWLDRGSYVMGGEIQYEVMIKNVGSTAIDLPWSADLDAIEVTGLPFVQINLWLVAKDRTGRDYMMGAVFLNGTTRMPETLQQLNPGETASIMAKGLMPSDPEHAPTVASSGPLQVRAVLQWQGNATTLWAPVHSANSLTATFNLRKGLQ